MEKIRILVKNVGEQPTEILVDDTLESYQKIVGGYIETVHIGSGIILVCNEEGLLEKLDYNFNLFGNPIVGNCFFISSNGSEFASLSDAQIQAIKKIFGTWL